jgi:hypothetical protein
MVLGRKPTRPKSGWLWRPTPSGSGSATAASLSHTKQRPSARWSLYGRGQGPLRAVADAMGHNGHRALWPRLSLANRRAAPSASRWASRWPFDTSTPMVSYFIFSMPLLVIRGSPPGIRPGQRKRRGRSNSSSTRQTVSVLPIRPSPLTRGQQPSPSGSFSPSRREKS